jgi:hypothetical protein
VSIIVSAALIIISADETEIGTADFHGLYELILRICVNPRFLSVAETMINVPNVNLTFDLLC